MKRLIIVGNGFDLAHNLPTRYSDFIKDYLLNVINSFYQKSFYSDELIYIGMKPGYRLGSEKPIKIDKVFEVLNKFKDKNEFDLRVNSELLRFILFEMKDIEDINWVNIEAIYYQKLLQLFNKLSDDNRNNRNISSKVESLNKN